MTASSPRKSSRQGVLIVRTGPPSTALDRPAPIRETYTLVPESAERQRQIIHELNQRNVQWVIVNDLATIAAAQYTFNTSPRLAAHPGILHASAA